VSGQRNLDSRRQRRRLAHIAVQTGEVERARTFFGTASTKNQELLRELGVDETYRLHENKNSKTWARDVDLVLDLIGGETQERFLVGY